MDVLEEKTILIEKLIIYLNSFSGTWGTKESWLDQPDIPKREWITMYILAKMMSEDCWGATWPK